MTTEDTNTPKPHLVDELLEILGSPGITETTYWKMRAAISGYLADHMWQEQQAKIAAREPLLAHEIDPIEREDSSLLRQVNKEIIASRGQVSTVCFYCGVTVTRGTDYPADAEDACYLGNDPGGLEPYVTDPDGYVRHASFVEECRPRDLRYTLPVADLPALKAMGYTHKEADAMLSAAMRPELHQFFGHADAPTTWCVVPDSRTENGYCGQPKDAAIHANFELADELRKAIFDVELMIELNQVTDGPRNDKERAEQAERAVSGSAALTDAPVTAKDSDLSRARKLPTKSGPKSQQGSHLYNSLILHRPKPLLLLECRVRLLDRIFGPVLSRRP